MKIQTSGYEQSLALAKRVIFWAYQGGTQLDPFKTEEDVYNQVSVVVDKRSTIIKALGAFGQNIGLLVTITEDIVTFSEIKDLVDWDLTYRNLGELIYNSAKKVGMM